MRLNDYIRQNAAELRRVVGSYLGRVPATASCDCPRSGTEHRHVMIRRLSLSELREWVLNDEGLYAEFLGASRAGRRV